MYDAIIIGARVAGSPTAMLLARKGYRVLLLDRDQFPSDTISTHIIFPKGFSMLRKWGLDALVAATGAPFISRVTFDAGSVLISGSPPPLADGTKEIITPRRYMLDQILVNAAVEAGAELRENCSVEEILVEDGIVTGVQCRTQHGAVFTAKARIVIGADGKNSLVARTVNAEQYHEVPKLSCWYYAYWSGVPIDELRMYSIPHRVSGVIPTNDGLVCIPVAWTADEFITYRSDVEGNYMKTIGQIPHLREMMQNAKRETPFTGMADLPNFFRKPFGPGWALVGDAGYHKDPITGQGISDAMTCAERLAGAIDKAFSGRESLDDALLNYQKERDEDSLPMYQLTCDWAALQPLPPEMEFLFQAMSGRQEEIDQFVGAVCGTVSIPAFFDPENMQRIMTVTA